MLTASKDQMRVKEKRLNACLYRTDAVATPEVLHNYYSTVLGDFSKIARINGFRKGKAPKHLVENMYKNKILKETEDRLINDQINRIRDEGAIFIWQPEAEELTSVDDVYAFSIKYEKEPEVKLKNFRNIRLLKVSEDVNDAAILDNRCRALTSAFSEWRPAAQDEIITSMDRIALAIDSNNKLVIQINLAMDEKSEYRSVFDGKKTEDNIVLDKKFLKKLLRWDGARLLGDVSLVSTSEKTNAKILGFYRLKSTPSEEDIAKKLGYKDIDTFKKAVASDIQKSLDAKHRQKLLDQINLQLLSQYKFDLPESLVVDRFKDAKFSINNEEDFFDKWLDDVSNEAREKRLTQDVRATAEKIAKLDLILKGIAQQENFTITEQDLKSWIEHYSILSLPVNLNELSSTEEGVVVIRRQAFRYRVLTFILETLSS